MLPDLSLAYGKAIIGAGMGMEWQAHGQDDI